VVSHFDGYLDVRDLNDEAEDGEIRLMLLSPLVYHSELLGRIVTVPTSFVTDLASIPRLLFSAIPPMGRYDKAAVIHDWLYQRGTVNRGEADAVFNEAMGVSGVGRIKRWTLYSGVRVGGWRPWARYREQGRVEVLAKVEASLVVLRREP
jgi:hypothetical protein